MVTDQQTNTIFFSDKLEDECPEVYKEVMKLKEVGLPIEFLHGTKAMWARDYMPIQVAPNRFVAFEYSPDYLIDSPSYKDTVTDNAVGICRTIVGDDVEIEKTDIVIDGGNVIKCDDAVIMVEKVLWENPQYSASALLKELERLFGCDIYIIPWDLEEGVYGHSDGVLRYIGNNELLFTKYPDIQYIKDVKRVLRHHFTKNHEIWMPGNAAKCREKFQWAYINYIRTKDYILMPSLSKNANCPEDISLKRQFELRFPDYAKENIIPVYALPALKKEGGLHCCSWNILWP